MNLSELNNLDFNNMGSWPVAVKATAVVLVVAAILAAVYYYDTVPQEEVYKAAVAKETELRAKFERDQRKAANLEPLRMQLAQINESFGAMLKRLPNTSEIPELLVEISQQGLGTGLEFEHFKPGSERPTDFYIELPIAIKVVGDYHQFGKFVSGVSALTRIVTIGNVSIKRQTGEGGRLVMEATAKTYRYADGSEEETKP